MIKFISFFLSAILLILSFSGIRRHDVNQGKFTKLAMQRQFDCVGRVFSDTIKGASCVLIGERTVLTAAHLFIESDTRPDTIIMNGMKIVVYQSINERVGKPESYHVEFGDTKRKIKRILIHPTYIDSLYKGLCDLAILELDEPITTIPIPAINNKFDEMNCRGFLAGFGAIGPANRPDLVKPTDNKAAGENIIDSIGGPLFQGNSTLLCCDMDHPKRKDVNKSGAIKPLPLEFITTGGDSGGGLFRKKGKTWELIGITSGGGLTFNDLNNFMDNGYYGKVSCWTRVSVFGEWIRGNFPNMK